MPRTGTRDSVSLNGVLVVCLVSLVLAGVALLQHHAEATPLIDQTEDRAAGNACTADSKTVKQPAGNYNSEPSDLRLSTPDEAVASFRLPDELSAQVFAAEPLVQQPISMAFDARGRLWVAECYTYAESQLNFDRSLKDRIVILEDSNRDGVADVRKVFWDQATQLTSVEVGYGGVWAICAPHLLFIPDANGDDIPDSDPIVMLDGWDNDSVRHNIGNGLRWGPDGWLYGRHGIMATSYVGRPGSGPDARTAINCGIWRYHPRSEKFEVVARGGTNSWGMDWDEHGELFFINTVIGHLWHAFPGAHFERMYGEHFNPHLYELMAQTADHFHWDTNEAWSDLKRKGMTNSTDEAGGGHAHCGMMIYLGDNWPDEFRGDVFTVNLHGHRINRDALERHGSGYVGHHRPDTIKIGDPWFRGIELVYGPDGSVLIADWTDVGECHENDGVHRFSGRIFRVASSKPATVLPQSRELPDDLNQWKPRELARTHRLPNEWYTRQARLALNTQRLAGQDVSEAVADLWKMAENRELPSGHRCRALWTLFTLEQADRSRLVSMLADPDEHLRVAAIRMLTDQKTLDYEEAAKLVEMAHSDISGLVLLYVASSLPVLPLEQRWQAARGLATRADFAGDVNLQLLTWYQMEATVAQHPDRALQLLADARMPKLQQFIARRLTAASRRDRRGIEQLIERLAVEPDRQRLLNVLRGMTDALRGWRQAREPAAWEAALAHLGRSDHTEVKSLIQELGVVFGDGRAVDELRELVMNRSAALSERRNAIRVLVDGRDTELPPKLQALLTERDLAESAIRGLAAFDDPETAKTILKAFNRLYSHARYEAANTLASRPQYARELIAAIEEGRVEAQYVSPFLVRQMQSFGDPEINKSLTRIWPDLERRPAEVAARMEQLRQALSSNELAEADRSNGRLLFQKSCASCHTLFGTGGKVAPDLTGAQRTNINYLLENILAPSAQVAENYRVSIVLLSNGRVVNGVIRKQNAETTEIQTPTELLVIPTDDIEETRLTKLSMMPERLMDVLSEQQQRDLLAYLMSPSQVPLPDVP